MNNKSDIKGRENDKRCGFISLIGAANAGKSTLLNKIIGAKLAIVTHKAQTTRFRTIGIRLWKNTQMIFVDLPGIFKPKKKLDKAMVKSAWQGAQDADIIGFVVDAHRGLTEEVRKIAQSLSESHYQVWLILNKIDLIAREKLLPLSKEIFDLVNAKHIFMVSAANGDGIDDFLDELSRALPVGPFLYPEDELTDVSDRLLVAELVREQIFLQIHNEVPYQTTVETESYKQRPDGSYRIDVIIYVQRASQRSILIGEGGRKIKLIGMRARQEAEKILECRCHLFLSVKERAGWDEKKAHLHEIKLELE